MTLIDLGWVLLLFLLASIAGSWVAFNHGWIAGVAVFIGVYVLGLLVAWILDKVVDASPGARHSLPPCARGVCNAADFSFDHAAGPERWRCRCGDAYRVDFTEPGGRAFRVLEDGTERLYMVQAGVGRPWVVPAEPAT